MVMEDKLLRDGSSERAEESYGRQGAGPGSGSSRGSLKSTIIGLILLAALGFFVFVGMPWLLAR